METQKKFYEGTNFWISVLMFVGTFFALPLELGTQVVLAFSGVVGAIGAARLWLKTKPQADWRKALARDANTWQYLSGVVLAILPMAGDLVPALRDVVDAVVQGQWNLILTRLVTLGTVIFFLLRQPPAPQPPQPATPTR